MTKERAERTDNDVMLDIAAELSDTIVNKLRENGIDDSTRNIMMVSLLTYARTEFFLFKICFQKNAKKRDYWRFIKMPDKMLQQLRKMNVKSVEYDLE